MGWTVRGRGVISLVKSIVAIWTGKRLRCGGVFLEFPGDGQSEKVWARVQTPSPE